jgi:hypothetical protein
VHISLLFLVAGTLPVDVSRSDSCGVAKASAPLERDDSCTGYEYVFPSFLFPVWAFSPSIPTLQNNQTNIVEAVCSLARNEMKPLKALLSEARDPRATLHDLDHSGCKKGSCLFG